MNLLHQKLVFCFFVAKTINRVHNQMSYSNTVIVLLKKKKIWGEWGDRILNLRTREREEGGGGVNVNSIMENYLFMITQLP